MEQRRVVVFSLVLLIVSLSASAQQAGGRIDQQVREYDQQWKELSKSDPAGWDKFKASLVLRAQQDLARFGYGTIFTGVVDEKTKEALRIYQQRNGLRQTADVDASTWVHLQHDAAALDVDIPWGPGYLFGDANWGQFVSAEGVWLPQGKEPDGTIPVRASRIECFKSQKICVAATDTGTQIHMEWFDVARWDEHEIETEPYDLPCGRETLLITKADKTVLTINTAVYKNAEACAKLFGPPEQPIVSRLGDANKIMDARSNALREARQRIELISAEAKRRAGLTDH